MEMNKAKNILVHEKEIYSRPAKVWFQAGKRPLKEGMEYCHGNYCHGNDYRQWS